jgi:hypothetical protein
MLHHREYKWGVFGAQNAQSTLRHVAARLNAAQVTIVVCIGVFYSVAIIIGYGNRRVAGRKKSKVVPLILCGGACINDLQDAQVLLQKPTEDARS